METWEERFKKQFGWLIASYKSIDVKAYTEEDYKKGKILAEMYHQIPDDLEAFIKQERLTLLDEIKAEVEGMKKRKENDDLVNELYGGVYNQALIEVINLIERLKVDKND